MQPTIHDVAKLAGVSPRTVSRVCNNSGYVSASTRIRVNEAIAELGYRPNQVARALAGVKAKTLGVVIGQEPRTVFGNPFMYEVLSGIGEVASRKEYQVLLFAGGEEMPHLSLYNTRQVGATIFMSVSSDDDRVKALVERECPVVLTCHYSDERVFSVDVDNAAGAAMATQHLLTLGHRNIAFISGPPSHMNSQERLIGYKRALSQHGIDFDSSLVMEGVASEEGGYQVTQVLLSVRPDLTAIFASSDLSAIGAMKALSISGKRVPQDVSVVGFDDISMAGYLHPPLTTVRQNGREKGAIAAEMAIQLAEGNRPQRRYVMLRPELVTRESTGSYRVTARTAG